jgi:lipoprotein-releasing system ATP-binding protein
MLLTFIRLLFKFKRVIRLQQITKSFGSLQVIKGVDLNIQKGEIVTIVGASGAGKTTLLQIMGTLLKPDSGSIMYNSTDISELNQKQLSRFRNSHIGFIFQFHHLLPEFNALENVYIPSLIAKKPFRNAENRAKELLRSLNLGDRMYHKPAELSGGEQQRVAAARALMNEPTVILADEPSGNLDSKHKNELHELFFKLREKYNQTFVIVTHDNSLAQMSDRILTIEDGVI